MFSYLFSAGKLIKNNEEKGANSGIKRSSKGGNGEIQRFQELKVKWILIFIL